MECWECSEQFDYALILGLPLSLNIEILVFTMVLSPPSAVILVKQCSPALPQVSSVFSFFLWCSSPARTLKLTVCVDIFSLQIKGFVPKGNKNTSFNTLKLFMCYYDFPELKPQKMETHIVLFPSSKSDLVTRVCSFFSFSRVFKQLLLHYIQDISIIAVFLQERGEGGPHYSLIPSAALDLIPCPSGITYNP